MHKQRLFAVGGAVLGMLVTGLAHLAPGKGIHTSLWITLGLFTVAWLVALSSEPTQPLSSMHRWCVGVSAACAVIVAALELPTLWANWQHEGRAYLTFRLQVWIICYLGVMLAGTLVLISVAVPWRGQVRTNAVTRRWLAWAGMGVCLVLAAWVAKRMLTYGPADQVTYAQIQRGMTIEEVEALFGRPPFLDSDTVPLSAEMRQALLSDKTNRGWDGPEGQIIVTFDRAGLVEIALFTPASHPPTPLDRLRARLGLWP
jgi:hypothetical protein